jgi:hypothetical protein
MIKEENTQGACHEISIQILALEMLTLKNWLTILIFKDTCTLKSLPTTQQIKILAFRIEPHLTPYTH